MNRTMLKSKVHRATVTASDLHYLGSITIVPDEIRTIDNVVASLPRATEVTATAATG